MNLFLLLLIFSTFLQVFGQVRNLTVEKIDNGANGMHFRWSAPSGGHSFNYTVTMDYPRSLACPSSFTTSDLRSTLHTTDEQLFFPVVQAFTDNKFSVVAHSVFGSSEPSELVFKTSEGEPEEPPWSLKATEIDSDGLVFDWGPIRCFHANGHLAYRYSLSIVDDSQPEIESKWIAKDVETKNNSVTFNNLAKSTDYEFSVKGFTSVGEGPTNEIVVQIYGLHGPKLNKEPVITEVETDAIGIEWTPGSANEEYRVMYRPTRELGPWVEYGEWQTETSSKVTNLSSDTNYEITVRVREDGSIGPIGPTVLSPTKCVLYQNNTKSMSFKVEALSVSEVQVSWQHLESSCKSLVYSLKVFDFESPKGLLSNQTTTSSRYRIHNLKPYTKYEAQVEAQSKCGGIYNYTSVIFVTHNKSEEIMRIVDVDAHNLTFAPGSHISAEYQSYVTYNITGTLISTTSCNSNLNQVHYFINASINEEIHIFDLSPCSEYKFKFEIERADGKKWLTELKANTKSSSVSTVITNVRLTERGPNRLTFRWDPIGCGEINSPSLAYEYHLLDIEKAKIKMTRYGIQSLYTHTRTHDTNVTFDNLNANSPYLFIVFASTDSLKPVTLLNARTTQDPNHPPGVSLVQSTNNNLLFDIIPSVTSQGAVTAYQVQIGSTQGPNGASQTKQWNVKVRSATKGGWGQWGSTLTFDISDH